MQSLRPERRVAELGSLAGAHMKTTLLFLVVGLIAGCVSPPRYDEVAAKAVFKNAIVPLPPDRLLGAESLTERDAIFESVAVAFVSGTRRQEFIGFKSYEGDGERHYDPPPEFLKHVRATNRNLKPVSDLSRLSRSERDVLWGKPIPVYYLYGMKQLSADEAEVYVEVAMVFRPHGTFFHCRVSKQDGKWKTISTEAQRPSVIHG